MKRAVALQPLSHQHHNALMACMLINKGIAKAADTNVMRDFVANLWNEDLLPHFKAEETFLFPLFPPNHPYKKVIEREHETLSLLIQRISIIRLGYTQFKVFARLLEDHIRFEERIAFNYLQDVAGQAKMEEVEKSLSSIHSRKCTDYPKKFWE